MGLDRAAAGTWPAGFRLPRPVRPLLRPGRPDFRGAPARRAHPDRAFLRNHGRRDGRQRAHRCPSAAPLQPRSDAAGYHSVGALGPDLMENARNAVRYTIDWLVADHGLSREDAYILCSLAGDLRISQIVDQPNWGVSFYLPLSVFS